VRRRDLWLIVDTTERSGVWGCVWRRMSSKLPRRPLYAVTTTVDGIPEEPPADDGFDSIAAALEAWHIGTQNRGKTV